MASIFLSQLPCGLPASDRHSKCAPATATDLIAPRWRRTLPRIALAFVAASLVARANAAEATGPGLIRLQDAPGVYRCQNDNAVLTIQQNPWRLRLSGLDGRDQYVEADAPAFRIRGEWTALARTTDAAPTADGGIRIGLELANGVHAHADVTPYGEAGFRVLIHAEGRDISGVRGSADLRPVEEIYGFGEMWNGHVAQRGQAFDLWDKSGTPDECAYMPYFVSTANYALFLNYGGRVHFDVGQHRADRITFEAPASELDLTLVRGDSIPSTVRSFLTTMGLPQRPPRWAFQPWFWLMSDPAHPGGKIDTLKGEHFIGMVQKLHDLSIPVGVTWFEPPWQDARNSFEPNPSFSTDVPGLVRQLEAMGVHTLAWTSPYTTDAAVNWKEALAHGYLVRKPTGPVNGKVSISTSGELAGNYYTAIDFFNPAAFRWWQHEIERGMATGIRGYKLDAGQDLPADALLYGGRHGEDVHNSYAREYDRVFFETLQRRFGNDFLMVPRAAWMGSSAYTNFKWPGDLSGSFANNGLPSSVYSSLSLAFCGIPFVSTDIGGFENQPAPEVPWLRWAQFGAMLPGMQTLHMPWWYSPEALAHFRYLAWLHTDLTPYWMSLAHEATATGAPVCRPLVWTFQADEDCWRVDDEFTVGPSLLVAPILNANPDRSVYLPAGEWFDFWDESEIHRGPGRIDWFKGWTAPDKFPLFVRAGAIIPMEISNAVTGFGWPESTGYVTLALWPQVRGSSSFTLHDTEGAVKIEATWDDHDVVRIAWGPTHRNHLLRVHLDTNLDVTQVTGGAGALAHLDSVAAFRAGGEGWHYDVAHRNLWLRRLNDGTGDALNIRLGSPP